jgi:radical SAM superfamily enzyme YgiQ (UPF0313 family)
MKLLLINPRFPESFWSFSWAINKVTRDKKTINSPLGLATLAALTPAEWGITIIDENVEPIDWDFEADIVGVCGMGVQVARQKEILQHFRKRGVFTVAGGSYASLCPEEYYGLVDTVVAGESEKIWPQFCDDFVAGHPQKHYQETGEIDLVTSPVPRYDLLKLDVYQKVSLQFSRGCPFNCEFCDIIVMFGRKPRTKSPEQIGLELDLLRQHGVTNAFFVDDNLIGHLPQAQKLLAYLAAYQKKHNYRFSFGTEASLNMATDTELLQLFKAANFEWVFIGIESPNAESLKETKKNQNLREDIQTSIRTIYSYGIDIMAGFIVGFDSDDQDIFERQYQLIVGSGISVAMVALLYAIPKTPLYKRLKEAGRLEPVDILDNTRPTTNIVPQRMTREELVTGYLKLYQRLLRDRVTYQRLANKIRYLKDPIVPPYLSWKIKLQYFGRFFFSGIVAGGPRRFYYFLRSFALGIRHPKNLAIIISDWIAILSLKAFADRYFEVSSSRAQAALQFLQQKLLRRIAEPIERGLVALRLETLQDRLHIWVDIRYPLDRKVMNRLARSVRQTLKRSREAVVVDCRHLKASSAVQLEILLKKLRRYHHQIHFQITEALHHQLSHEFALFHYTLVPVPGQGEV